MDKGILITADNKICIKDFERPLYESVGTAVGGCIELVRCAAFPSPIKNAVMIVCDDGLLKNLRLNMAGSCMYGTPFHGSPIVGDIVIMKMGYTDDGFFKTRAVIDNGSDYIMLCAEAEASVFQHVTNALIDSIEKN